MAVHNIAPQNKQDNPVAIEKNNNPLSSLQNEANKMFRNFFGDLALPSIWSNDWGNFRFRMPFATTPAVDITENDKEFSMTVELPGMDAKDIQVTTSGNSITVRGEKSTESSEEKNGYFRQERSQGFFQRSMTLPDSANLDKAESSISKGVLTVTIPKKAEAIRETKRINIKQVA